MLKAELERVKKRKRVTRILNIKPSGDISLDVDHLIVYDTESPRMRLSLDMDDLKVAYKAKIQRIKGHN